MNNANMYDNVYAYNVADEIIILIMRYWYGPQPPTLLAISNSLGRAYIAPRSGRRRVRRRPRVPHS